MSPDDAEQMHKDLEAGWHHARECAFRYNLKVIWTTAEENLTNLRTGDKANSYIQPDMFNKPVAIYFEQSAQYGAYDDVRGYLGGISRQFIASIFEAWRVRCGSNMNIEYGHFLANPVRIEKTGPQNLREILTVHKAMCNMARERKIRDLDYGMQKTYPGVILVCDRRPSVEEGDKGSEGILNIRKIGNRLTVLVMRTEDPVADEISLDALDRVALPLDRPDAHGLDLRRVPMYDAIDFIVTLESRLGGPPIPRRKYCSGLTSELLYPQGFDWIVNTDPQMYATAMMTPGACAPTPTSPSGPETPGTLQEAIHVFKSGNGDHWADVAISLTIGITHSAGSLATELNIRWIVMAWRGWVCEANERISAKSLEIMSVTSPKLDELRIFGFFGPELTDCRRVPFR